MVDQAPHSETCNQKVSEGKNQIDKQQQEEPSNTHESQVQKELELKDTKQQQKEQVAM